MKYIQFYPECVIITAVVLYIKHLLYPYDFREKFPYDDPPPKFLVLSHWGISTIYNPSINVTYYRICYDSFAILGKVADVILIILLVMWWFIPTGLARKIDGW